MEEQALVRALVALRTDEPASSEATVSIVVTNRNGADHLRRLLDGLTRRTTHSAIELILVDNESSDDSVAIVESWPGESRVIRNLHNQSFSAANNQGIRAARGDYVLLANNDIDPIDTNWLGYMVETLEAGAACVGAMLVYPQRAPQNVPPSHPDFTVQHLGTAFENSKWGVRATNLGMGEDPLAISNPRVRQTPAVTAACLLARRRHLLAYAFDEQYWYGAEDWDLCLRLRQEGPVVVDERAVLFHHEYGTQDRYISDERRDIRHRNHRWFNGLWGPSLRRLIREELTNGHQALHFRRPGPIRMTLISTNTENELTRQLRLEAMAAGWEISHSERAAADVVVALEPPKLVDRFASHDLSLALVVDNEEQWMRSGALDAAKHIVAPNRLVSARIAAGWGDGVATIEGPTDDVDSQLLRRLLDRLSPRPDAMRIGVSTCAPSWEKAQFWGDTYLARGLMRAFRRRGHETTEIIKPDWNNSRAASCDAVIHLRGLARRPVCRGQWNMLWIISHPDRVEPDEYDDYDVIACASPQHACELTQRLGRVVHSMPQATDADTFKVGAPAVDLQTSVLYVGNSRWPNRRAPRWMMRNGRSFDLFGRNWDDFPEHRFVRSDYIDNRDLAAAYRSAEVVVADHHGSMRTGGFIANRLFDVLASGGLVLSDDVEGLSSVFGDAVPIYTNPRELESQLRILLADRELRADLARRGREIVSRDHTLDHRADEWLGLLEVL